MAPLALAALAAGACSGHQATSDASHIDAGADAGPDAETLCPGALSFEGLVEDLITDKATFEVTVLEDAHPSNTTSSAPNGRADLCLPTGTDSLLRSSKTDYLDRIDLVSAAAFPVYHGAAQPYPLQVITTADFDDPVATSLGFTRDDTTAQVVVTVLQYPDATPLTGATVALGKQAAVSAARAADGQFALSDPATIGAGGLVLFGNTQLAGGGTPGQTTVTVTPPGGFSGTCQGPTTVPLEANTITGVLFACQ